MARGLEARSASSVAGPHNEDPAPSCPDLLEVALTARSILELEPAGKPALARESLLSRHPLFTNAGRPTKKLSLPHKRSCPAPRIVNRASRFFPEVPLFFNARASEAQMGPAWMPFTNRRSLSTITLSPTSSSIQARAIISIQPPHNHVCFPLPAPPVSRTYPYGEAAGGILFARMWLRGVPNQPAASARRLGTI